MLKVSGSDLSSQWFISFMSLEEMLKSAIPSPAHPDARPRLPRTRSRRADIRRRGRPSGPAPVAPVTAEGERAIVESAAHP